MTEDDFNALGHHLRVLDPIIAAFCHQHGYERVTGPSVGRYPRIRLQQTESVTRWIDLWMGLDEFGRRFTRFAPDLPYELGAGAFVNDHECRYQKAFVIWPALPFSEVAGKLAEALASAAATLCSWDAAFLQAHGRRVVLG